MLEEEVGSREPEAGMEGAQFRLRPNVNEIGIA